MTKQKILFYDIETTPLKAWVWRCGKQVVRHDQLTADRNMYDIICITYCWNDNKKAQSLDWGYTEQDSSQMIAQFDELIKSADVTIGKNSDRFDVKHINTRRLLSGISGMPDWTRYTDDLEKQMRKYFYLPSYSLDYFSSLLGFGGKIKMEFKDWIDIVEKSKDGEIAFKKMIKYGKKDVEDTRAIWKFCLSHFEPKVKQFGNCPHCGVTEFFKNGTRTSGKTKYQRFDCKKCGGYVGRAPFKSNGQLGPLA